MRQPKPLIGPRPTGKRVLKEVELSDGSKILFRVFVIDPPAPDKTSPRKVQLMSYGGGRVPTIGAP